MEDNENQGGDRDDRASPLSPSKTKELKVILMRLEEELRLEVVTGNDEPGHEELR